MPHTLLASALDTPSSPAAGKPSRANATCGTVLTMQPIAPSHDSVPMMFATWMTGSRAAAAAAIDAAGAEGLDLVPALAALYQYFDAHRQRADPGFGELDDLLRSDSTTTVDLDHPLVRGQVRRLYVLQRELQRQCLSATLLALPVGRRAAFILIGILDVSLEHATAIMGSPHAASVALSRGERQLETYLESRCEHMDPDNLCHCSTRLGIALERHFVDWPEDNTLPGAPLVGQRRKMVRDLFATLPPPA